MTRPDLEDAGQRRAYRRELRVFARPWRLLGLGLILAGVAVLFVRGRGFDRLSVALIAAGWLVWIPVIVARTRHHRKRMAEPAAITERAS
jgi:hypothetical protein